MAANLTIEQEQATKEFLEIINKRRIACSPVSWGTAVKFLSARKFEVQRAVALYEQHEITRKREGLSQMQPTKEPLKSELQTGKFTVLPTRDSSGAAIAIFTAHLHLPHQTTHQTTLQGVVYQLDAALESKETQKHGLVFIYDMSDSKFQNFDFDLSQKILTLLKGGYPARLKKVLIVTAPLWFKAPFKILRLFVREKLRERVFTVSIPQLRLHVPRESLPLRLGGSLELSHETWLVQCLEAAMTAGRQQQQQQTNDGSVADTTTTNSNSSSSSSSSSSSGNGTNASVAAANGSANAVAPEQQDCESSGEGSSGPASPSRPQQQQPEATAKKSEQSKEHHPPPPPASGSASSGFSDDDSLHVAQVADVEQAADESGLRLVSMEHLVESVRERGVAALMAEYMEIKQRPPDGTFTAAKLKANLPKNRYTDVLCYDHSRVCLEQLDPNDPSCDYIHANYVDGYKQKNAFISTQGPLPKTIPDFWRMVWEQQSLVIVMTTRVVERGRNKCAQYWGPEIGDQVTAGGYNVTTLEVDRSSEYTISKLLLTKTKTEETREICHMLYTGWPDYGVPRSAKALLQFLGLVRQQQSNLLANLGDAWAGHPRGPPIVVHCSAGIGRTGTFCTLDICISRLEDTGSVDIRGTVEKIRSQRAFSIQMPDQYVFCHMALAEYALSRGMLSPQQIAMLPPTIEEDSD
ncbi:tyrosine-protein phosphatase non-receptor type 9 [Trichogramma pretiosum]|uniref:tyrosine-protein phosphatase non-receptor type 9 n=1 Tax=Trichogramma pretiosum TaxID=7493 RepID=UPI0006C9DE3B|nr:tyrosine-protein phosphatase non-receptor type 9 [Trichogramma pretiosum]